MGAGGERTTRPSSADEERAAELRGTATTPSGHDTEVESADAARAPSPVGTRPRRLRASGRLLGRYVIRRKLGSGGMALVYLADDPALQRELAIKVIRPRLRGDAARDRLLREAKAMARLEHPNVVQVFDVGTTGDDVYLVMPYLAGGTLGDWLAAGPRPWKAVLARFIAAGRGLAAAHAKGLVHRDFKPDNVLIGKDGEVRVADFGLAHVDAEPTPDPSRPDPAAPPHLTRTGALLGTPLYMAPEQLSGQPVSPRSDQFSFCVALWEGLHGERPFRPEPEPHRGSPGRSGIRLSAGRSLGGPGSDVARLLGAIARGPAPPSARGPRVPHWLRGLLARGLRADPDARWRSLDHMLDRLVARMNWPRRTAAVLGAVAAAAALIAAFAASGREREPERRAIAAPAAGEQRAYRTSRITARGRVSEAALSPDGAALAWVVQADVIVQSTAPPDPAGAHPRVLLRDAARATLAFSPDGKRLAVTNPPGRTRVVDVASGEVLVDAEVGEPLLGFAGPDAIVYSDHGSTLTRRLLASPTESRECALPRYVRAVADLAAAPDGEVLLLIDRPDDSRALMRVGAGCEDPRLLRVDSWGKAVAAGPTAFHALRRSAGEVSLVSLDRDGAVTEVRGLDSDVADLAGVAPDGRAFFVRTEYEWRLVEVGEAGATELANGVQPAELAVSPDGASIAWVEDGDDRRALRVAPVQRMADRPPPIAVGVMTVAWSTGGNRLAAIIDDGGRRELVVMNQAGAIQGRHAVAGVDPDDWMAWLDGDSIVATALDHRNLLRIDISSGAMRPLLEERGDVADPQTSPERGLLFNWDRDDPGAAGVWLRAPGGQLTHLREDADRSMHAAWSADGAILLYDRWSGEVWRLASPGGDPVRIAPVPLAGNEWMPALWPRGRDRVLAHLVRQSSDLHISRPD
jgi:hypothetical protein